MDTNKMQSIASPAEQDKFFSAKECQRCGGDLTVRTMSWFTDETICLKCMQHEDMVKMFLPNSGADHEGCGYVPEQCDHCNGYGSSFKEDADRCTKCHGTGLMEG